MPSLGSVSFDASTLKFQEQTPERKVWFTRDGDSIALYHFPKSPDIPRGLTSVAQLREHYLRVMQGTPARLVSVEIVVFAKCRSIQLIIKSPQQPSGMAYVGSLTIPFRNFSFVVKAQCMEHGITGIREAVLFERKHKSGSIEIDASGRIVGDWSPDNERYDSEFPTHPLSRLRSILQNVKSSCTLDPEIRQHAAFELP